MQSLNGTYRTIQKLKPLDPDRPMWVTVDEAGHIIYPEPPHPPGRYKTYVKMGPEAWDEDN